MTLGNRIKEYEKVSYHLALKRMPLIIRVDGKSFHTFTKEMQKPFDPHLIDSMIYAAKQVAKEMQGFKVAYIQSDEVTFCLTDYDTLETQGWFNYELPKIISISASMMTLYFNANMNILKNAFFDSRAFNVPKEDIVNTFLWRAKDWERNSLQMYCRYFFSHKEIYKKNKNDIHNMLHNIGKNWTKDLSDREKNGTFLLKMDKGIKERSDILPTYENIANEINSLIIHKEYQEMNR